MSISFNVTQVRQIRNLNTWLDCANGVYLKTAREAEGLLLGLDKAYEAYRRGGLPLSEVRKHHRAVCDFLTVAARRHVELRFYGDSQD